MPIFSEWQTFYVITGSAAGALIGLQFVVLTLIANGPRRPDLAEARAAFSTPTIVQFASVLGIAAVLAAPWQASLIPLIVLSVAGLIGTIYSIRNLFVMRRQSAYIPGAYDWTFYAVLPISAYVFLAAVSVISFWQLYAGLFGIAAVAVLLLAIGIHNAWDSVSYHVFESGSGKHE